jgi:hypothetical protein
MDMLMDGFIPMKSQCFGVARKSENTIQRPCLLLARSWEFSASAPRQLVQREYALECINAKSATSVWFT